METLGEAPSARSFIPLSEHQSATPASFHSGPPVLHYYSDRCKVLVLGHELSSSPALAKFVQESQAVPKAHDATSNGDSTEEGDSNPSQLVVEEVDIWVTSSTLLLYKDGTSTGLSIPYPSIALHAIQSLPQPTPDSQQGVYMQVISSTPDPSSDDLPDSVSITMIPTASAPRPAASTAESDPIDGEDQASLTPVTAMFNALSNCSNLHPDPIDPEDQDAHQLGDSHLFQAGMLMPGDAGGGLPPAMPGSGGWITSENMHEYVDEEGNWIGGGDEMEAEEEGESLGPGAGSIRTRDDAETEQVNGGSDETKWRRTS